MNSRDKAERRLGAMTWWVAAMLARRNNELIVWETHPLDGFYDCLGVREAHLSEWGTTIEMNRHGGSIHLHNGPDWKPIRLGDVLEHNEPLEIVAAIESSAQWKQGATKTSSRALTYRVIARVLQSLVDEREDWDARLSFPPEESKLFLDTSVIRSFELGEHLLSTVPQRSTKFAPWEHVWILRRGDAPVARLDTAGRAVTHRGMVDMMAVYRQNGRRLEPVIHAALGRVLP